MIAKNVEVSVLADGSGVCLVIPNEVAQAAVRAMTRNIKFDLDSSIKEWKKDALDLMIVAGALHGVTRDP